MRNKFAQVFLKKQKNSKLTVCVADISPAGAMNEFRSEYPDALSTLGLLNSQ